MSKRRLQGESPDGSDREVEREDTPPPFSSDDEEEEIVEEVVQNEEEEGEDLFGDDMLRDYQEMPRLDRYDGRMVDDAEYEDMDDAERRMIDQMLNRRDREQAVLEGRLPEAFLSDDMEEGPGLTQFGKFRFGRDDGADLMEAEDAAAVALTDAESANYSLQEFVMMENYRRRIAYDYRTFLTTYLNEEGAPVYNQKIRAMCAANLESLEVSYNHLADSNAFLAKLLANVPGEILKIFDETTMSIVLEQFEDYGRIQNEIHVRIIDYPTVDRLCDLRNNHLNAMIRVSGVVTRRTGVFPHMKLVKFDCSKCGKELGPFTQDLNSEFKVSSCNNCDSKGPFTVNTQKTIYENYQKVTLQESPGTVSAGRLPRHKEVVLLADLIDCARPGEEIEVTGIYKNNFSIAMNNKHGFPVFETIIEANYVCKKQDLFASTRLTEDDQQEIRKLSSDPNIGQRIIKSIAPSIYGHENIKTAIALSMFGGQPKNIQNKHRVRGDINVLLLGDPGTAKSQFLKYIEKTAHRAVYTTGQGASAVGLTASVHKDPVTKEWTLEGGALVLADNGICLIDEFDKMNDTDRTSIHEAMEQQSISISKAGIVTTLQARCAIIAAANPIRGRYNPSIPFNQNVELTEPILSRFDVLCVVKDNVDPVTDEALAKFVVSSHMKSHPDFDPQDIGEFIRDFQGLRASFDEQYLLTQDQLKKYVLYAKSHCHPKISDVDSTKIAKLYADLRKESLNNGGIPITVRHLESIVRLAEAHARMHLRDTVRADDVDLAIRVMLESFISSQKYSVMKQLKKGFAKYVTYRRDHYELLLFLVQESLRETLRYYHYRFGDDNMPPVAEIEAEDFESKAKELGINDVQSFYSSKMFTGNGFRYNPTSHQIEKDI